VLGSPGSAIRRARQLAVPAGQVFVGAAHWDPIAGSGYFGTDPGSPGFGSRSLDLSPLDLRMGDDVFRRPSGHNGYLDAGTSSLHDIALIGLGRSDLLRTSTPGGDSGSGGGDPLPAGTPGFMLVRPQDLHLRD
jgi:hypothetical protein